ncbi:hypothetical protein [Aeromonas sanarellii]|uniref:hypothetical protein n=1 Tax=Aeromonas sanarellii TaxID=633415 RepID=UPI003BA1C081
MTFPKTLNTPSGMLPIPPQEGQGPDRQPVKVMFVEFSMKMPDGNMVPQLSHTAGMLGIFYSLAQRIAVHVIKMPRVGKF